MDRKGAFERVREIAAPVGLALLVGLGGCAVSAESQHETTERPAVISEGIPTPFAIPTTERNTCIEPTVADFAAVDTLLTEPPEPVFQGMTSNKLFGSQPSYDDIINAKKAVAEANGLSIFDATPLVDELQGRMTQEGLTTLPTSVRNNSFPYYLNATNEFMDQLGVKVDFGNPNDQFDLYGRQLSDEELKSNSAKQALISVLQAFSNLPKEYVEYAGLKRIVLVGGPDSSVGVHAMTDGILYVNVNSDPKGLIFDSESILHGLGHLVDSVSCGTAMNNDPGYTAFSGENYYTDRGAGPSYNYLDEYNADMSRIIPKMMQAQAGNNRADYCILKAEAQKLATDVEGFTDYGATNPKEDKAVMYSQLEQPNTYAMVADEHFTTLYDKFRYLLARTYNQIPAVVKYFAKTRYLPVEDSSFPDC